MEFNLLDCKWWRVLGRVRKVVLRDLGVIVGKGRGRGRVDNRVINVIDAILKKLYGNKDVLFGLIPY